MSERTGPEPGWVIEVEGRAVGARGQTAEVLEVLGAPGHEHYRVRWSDGHESIFFPSSDAHVRPPHAAARARSR